jgi:phosphopantothenoylcysteine decarboxylase / phosphopantothenate---cysteine ligase
LALGLAGDLLTTLFLAFEPELPVWIAPAMNTVMWNKPVVQGHVATLRTQGARIIAPVAGELACGEEGVGAMAAAEVIVAALATPARQ